ncbi:serine/threonine-protein kinase [Actinoplanes sp. NPDC049265]|uniref:serine/threonine-protein kinase n=1 Tax=Actinoplanes sp. NPDC049265 TaxID=3363902 RepID=UPI003710AD62
MTTRQFSPPARTRPGRTVSRSRRAVRRVQPRFTLPAVAAPKSPGDRYELRAPIGRGSGSEVWHAHDHVLDRPVAVKVMDPEHAARPRARDELRDEARRMASIAHPHVVRVHDFGDRLCDTRPTPFITMDLLDGRNLHELAGDERLSLLRALRIGAQIADAVSAVHASGLVHLDVKPANVMVTADRATVVDFGISVPAGSCVSPARPSVVLGTPAYVAPERLTGGLVTPACDVYSLGILLFWLFTGRLPWTVHTTTQLLVAHVRSEPEPFPRRRGVPGEVAELGDRCLAKDPAARPDAREVAGTLARAFLAEA